MCEICEKWKHKGEYISKSKAQSYRKMGEMIVAKRGVVF
jgi:hypothetical protein